MRRFLRIFFVAILLLSRVHALMPEAVLEHTLDNGLSVFILEDSSDALIRVEYSVRAGFSSQSPSDTGFFSLYARLLERSSPSLSFSDVQCNSDSSRYILKITPSQLERTLDALSALAFSPQFTDELVGQELALQKEQVLRRAEDLSVFVNAGIDSRVFSAAPWKHDSGLYPSVISNASRQDAMTILRNISAQWYTPQNSAVFISGGVDAAYVLELVRQTFGRFYSAYGAPGSAVTGQGEPQRKFVLHHEELSPELTQVVLQYTTLDMEECDVCAALFNAENSTLKQRLLADERLKIPGDEYINVAAAHKQSSSRLVIQALLQRDESKKNRVTEEQQTELFVRLVQDAVSETLPQEFGLAQKRCVLAMDGLSDSADIFMENLSLFWAMEPFRSGTDSKNDGNIRSPVAASMLRRTDRLRQKDFNTIRRRLLAESPFVFSIVSTANFSASRKSYEADGYGEINQKNASWYLQKIYEELEFSENHAQSLNSEFSLQDFYEKNLAQMARFELQNGIPVVTKKNPLTSAATIAVKIDGGKLNSAENHGFEEVMVQLIAQNVSAEIAARQKRGIISGFPQVSVQAELSYSLLLVECEREDVNACIKSVSDALIYGELIPSQADRAVANRQYKKRMENGSMTNQLFAATVRQLFGKKMLYSVFETENDVLQKTSFEQFLAAYPDFLDSGRYKIIVAGNFDETIQETLNSTFGLLGKTGFVKKGIAESPDFPDGKAVRVKVRHTFLTDIPAELAGPMPAELVPTKEFLDPVLYILEKPKDSGAVFDALVLRLKSMLQAQLPGQTVSARLATSELPFAQLIVSDVTHIRVCDAAYKSAVGTLLTQLSSSGESARTAEAINNEWIFSVLSDAGTNKGTALLLAADEDYLESYRTVQSATAESFIMMLQEFPETPALKVYSADSKN